MRGTTKRMRREDYGDPPEHMRAASDYAWAQYELHADHVALIEALDCGGTVLMSDQDSAVAQASSPTVIYVKHLELFEKYHMAERIDEHTYRAIPMEPETLALMRNLKEA